MAKHELDDDREILYSVDHATQAALPESERYAWFEEEKEQYTLVLRNKRNELLLECDWTQAEDSPLSLSKKLEWKTYRQTLRDITLTNWKEDGTIWPIKP